MKRISLLFGCLFLLTLVACGPAKVSAPPDGAYQYDEVTADGTNTLILTFKQGRFDQTSSQYGDMASGVYKLDGDKISFTEETTSLRAKSFCGSKVNYSYQWSYDSGKKALSLKPDNDPCSIRQGAFTSGDWAYHAVQ